MDVVDQDYWPRPSISTWFELPLALGAATCAFRFAERGWFGSAAFYALFAAGLVFVGSKSIWEPLALRARWSSRSASNPAMTAPYSSSTTHALSVHTPVE